MQRYIIVVKEINGSIQPEMPSLYIDQAAPEGSPEVDHYILHIGKQLSSFPYLQKKGMYLIFSSVGIPAKTDGIIKQVIIKAQVEYFKRVFTTIFHVTPTHFVTATRQRFFFCLHRCFIKLNLLDNPRP